MIDVGINSVDDSSDKRGNSFFPVLFCIKPNPSTPCTSTPSTHSSFSPTPVIMHAGFSLTSM